MIARGEWVWVVQFFLCRFSSPGQEWEGEGGGRCVGVAAFAFLKLKELIDKVRI